MNSNHKAPIEISAISDLNRVKAGIRKWKPSGFPCGLFKKHLDNVGFILVPSKN